MLGENTPLDLDIDLLDSVLLYAIAATYKRCSAKNSNPIPLFGDLAAELAHWQDRDRNQKINAMAQMASTKLRAWVDQGPYARVCCLSRRTPHHTTICPLSISARI